MECLNCNSKKFIKKKLRFSPVVKGQKIDVITLCDVCCSCGEALMDSKQMTLFRRESADAYRAKNKLLTSKQIVAYRESLGMSQATFARYLNVGEASIKRWETHHVQDASQDEHIRLKCDEAYAESNYLNVHWKKQESDEYSGNCKFNLQLFKSVALFLVSKTNESIIFLNKLHYYVDFLHYKKHGVSLTGTRYVPLKYGPCPDQYRVIYDSLVQSGVLKQVSDTEYEALQELDLTLFDDQELETLEELYELYKEKGAEALYELSHKEKGYKDTPECKFISYDSSKSLLIG